MGTSQSKEQPYSRFRDDNFYKIRINSSHIYGRPMSIDLCEEPHSNNIIMSVMGRGARINVFEFKAEEIKAYAAKKKSKTIMIKKKKPIFSLPLRSSYVMEQAMHLTFNNKEKALFTAHGGLDNLCNIHRKELDGTKDISQALIHEIQIAEGYTSCFKFIPDESNRVIFGSGDYNVYMFDYLKNTHLLTIDCGKADVTSCDCFIDESTNLLIIAFSNAGGIVVIVSINNDTNEIVNIQSIDLGWDGREPNTIAISPDDNHQFIVCAGEMSYCQFLKRINVDLNDDKVEYELYKKGDHIYDLDSEDVNKNATIHCCAWLDEKTVVCGGEYDFLSGLEINSLRENEECVKIIANCMNKVDYLAKLILDFCGDDIERFVINTPFDDQRIPKLQTLPKSKVCPGMIVACSWDTSVCLFIPRNKM